MPDALSTQVQTRYSTQFLAGLTNPQNPSPTTVNTTTLDAASVDAKAALRTFCGVTYDDTIPMHVEACVEVVVATIQKRTGQWAATEDFFKWRKDWFGERLSVLLADVVSRGPTMAGGDVNKTAYDAAAASAASQFLSMVNIAYDSGDSQHASLFQQGTQAAIVSNQLGFFKSRDEYLKTLVDQADQLLARLYQNASPTAYNATIRTTAINNAKAMFPVIAGVAYDGTDSRHVAVLQTGAVAQLGMICSLENADQKWKAWLSGDLLDLAKVTGRDRIVPTTDSVVQTSPEGINGMPVRPDFDRPKFELLIPGGPPSGTDGDGLRGID